MGEIKFWAPLKKRLIVATMLFCAQPLAAQSLTELTLHDALAASLSQGNAQPLDKLPESSRWLASLPSIYVSYLDSNEEIGTDETEIGLSLPVKSPALRRIDRRLRALREEIGQTRRRQLALIYSGLIREAAWEHRIARAKVLASEKKTLLLEQLLATNSALLSAGAVDELTVLLIRKEILNARSESLSLQESVDRWRSQFETITGLGTVPENLEESSQDTAPGFIDQHPAIALLDLQWEQDKLLLDANGNAAQPWNLTVIGKNIDAPGLDEDQIGLMVEVPLQLSERRSVSASNSWLETTREYHRVRDARIQELRLHQNALEAEADALGRRLRLDQETLTVAEAITQQSDLLRKHNELPRTLVFRYLVEALDASAQASVTRLRIQQNEAKQRQAAGTPL